MNDGAIGEIVLGMLTAGLVAGFLLGSCLGEDLGAKAACPPCTEAGVICGAYVCTPSGGWER